MSQCTILILADSIYYALSKRERISEKASKGDDLVVGREKKSL